MTSLWWVCGHPAGTHDVIDSCVWPDSPSTNKLFPSLIQTHSSSLCFLQIRPVGGSVGCGEEKGCFLETMWRRCNTHTHQSCRGCQVHRSIQHSSWWGNKNVEVYQPRMLKSEWVRWQRSSNQTLSLESEGFDKQFNCVAVEQESSHEIPPRSFTRIDYTIMLEWRNSLQFTAVGQSSDIKKSSWNSCYTWNKWIFYRRY